MLACAVKARYDVTDFLKEEWSLQLKIELAVVCKRRVYIYLWNFGSAHKAL